MPFYIRHCLLSNRNKKYAGKTNINILSINNHQKKKIHAITQPHLCFDSCMSRSGSVKTVELTSAFCWQMQPKKNPTNKIFMQVKEHFSIVFFSKQTGVPAHQSKKSFFFDTKLFRLCTNSFTTYHLVHCVVSLPFCRAAPNLQFQNWPQCIAFEQSFLWK